ncbi:PIPOX [Branchiostoma lanceolatum]|uniref:PIPOX protein n=1 Tax=Branchiostoma lanceolatum TaxID=7740 RepID=A0A8J9V9P3_BRALA|nr:PIPOX [Branchiostoma lanceolatum]
MAEQREVWDVIVVGAGVMGSSTAFHLAQGGGKTLLLEQFFLPHTRGSSCGQTRIVRKSYIAEHAHYADMVTASIRIWKQVEKELGTTLMVPISRLLWARSENPKIHAIADTLDGVGARNSRLQGRDLRRRFPMLRFPPGYVGVLEEDAAVIKADTAVRCLQELFVKRGGRIKDGERILKVVPGQTITVTTATMTYRTRRLVLTCGAWAPGILRDLGLNLPLKPLRINVCYFKEKRSTSAHSLASNFPVIKDEDDDVYGIPSLEYPNMIKICRHVNWKTGHSANPEQRDVDIRDHLEEDVRYLGNLVRRHLPELEDKPAVVETCMYTNTPDAEFILDRHPQFHNIIIGTGFSGHGFKLGAAVGRLLSELATDKRPFLNMKPYRIARFAVHIPPYATH